MSYRDNTTSDMAINYLVDAACNYGIPSYILLSERDSELSLDKKITALAHHYGQSLDNVVDYPDCMKLINVSLSPSDEEIYKMTQSYINNKSLLIKTNQQLINNPLDKNNRIARIKRSREYQRQQMYNILKSSHSNNKDVDWKSNSAIVVLDLDLLAYPSPSDLIETARRYIVTPSSLSYQAICANGLMTVYSKSKHQRYVTRYYDTYSTILLPNAWLHRDSILSIKREAALDNNEHDINQQLSSMDQMEAVQYFIEQGRMIQDDTKQRHSSTTYTYKPVPVRSCFNGLTIYRTDVYLNNMECRYDSYNKEDEVYASNHYKHACEHVVIHECLRRQMKKSSNNEEFSMAVLPTMKTLWHGI